MCINILVSNALNAFTTLLLLIYYSRNLLLLSNFVTVVYVHSMLSCASFDEVQIKDFFVYVDIRTNTFLGSSLVTYKPTQPIYFFYELVQYILVLFLNPLAFYGSYTYSFLILQGLKSCNFCNINCVLYYVTILKKNTKLSTVKKKLRTRINHHSWTSSLRHAHTYICISM